MQDALGIPRSAISRDFERKVQAVLDKGELKQSSVSKLILGDNPPCSMSHPAWRIGIEKQLLLFDVIETIVTEKEHGEGIRDVRDND